MYCPHCKGDFPDWDNIELAIYGTSYDEALEEEYIGEIVSSTLEEPEKETYIGYFLAGTTNCSNCGKGIDIEIQITKAK